MLLREYVKRKPIAFLMFIDTLVALSLVLIISPLVLDPFLVKSFHETQFEIHIIKFSTLTVIFLLSVVFLFVKPILKVKEELKNGEETHI